MLTTAMTAAAGVIGIRLGANDRVIAFDIVEPDHDLLVVSQKGLGKRTPLDQYRSQGRGGKGILAMKLTTRTGPIMAAGMVHPDDNVMLMNSDGLLIKIAADTISRIGRSTQGVHLMKLQDGQSVRSMTVIEPRDPAAEARLSSLEDEATETEG